MDAPDRALTITKAEGATRQVEEAIRALQRGDFDVAITLAGAAEGMLERSGLHMWSYIKERTTAAGFDEKTMVNEVNAELYWLKHPTPDKPDTLTLTRSHAAWMIARAMTKLETWSPIMNEFRAWLKRNLDEL
jgi:hypothetical protein